MTTPRVKKLLAEVGSIVTASPEFKPGDAVLIAPRKDRAVVSQCFPKGSTSLAAPHCVVDFVGGDKNVKVPMSRVTPAATSARVQKLLSEVEGAVSAAAEPALVGDMPKTFWLVLHPLTDKATMSDVLVKTSFAGLMQLANGGLLSKEVAGFFEKESAAKEEAQRLLEVGGGKMSDTPPAGLVASLRQPYRIAVRSGLKAEAGKDTLKVTAPDRDTLRQYAMRVEKFAKMTISGDGLVATLTFVDPGF